MATSAVLDYTNLYTQSFWNVFNLLNTRTNVIDPLDASGSRKLVYSREPDLGRNFAGYPIIIVMPAKLKRSARKTLNDKNADVDGTITVEVRSSDVFFTKETASDPHGKGLTFLDQLSDDVLETLNSASNRNTLRNNNIGFVKVEEAGSDTIDMEGEVVYRREFLVQFNSPLLTVST